MKSKRTIPIFLTAAIFFFGIFVCGSDNSLECTESEFGGMYLDDNGTLVLCFTEGKILEDIINEKKEIENIGTVETLVKIVKYSQQELTEAYELINKYALKNASIKTVSEDVINNKIVIGVMEEKQTERIKNDLSSMNGIFSFEILTDEFCVEDIKQNGFEARERCEEIR